MNLRLRSLAFALLGLVALMWALPAAAFDAPPVELLGRHAITVHGSLLNHARVESSISPGTSGTRVSVPGRWLSYGYWPTPEWAVRFAVGVLDVETLTSTSPAASCHARPS